VGTLDVFVTKYTAAGSWVYTKQKGVAARNTFPGAVAVDTGGNVYVTGYTDGGLDGNTLTGTTDLFVTKYTSSGSWVYTNQMGAVGKDTVAKGVAIDSGGNVYVTGYTYGGLDGNTIMGITDYFLIKYNTMGNKVYTKQTGIAGNITMAYGIAVESGDNVYLTGSTTGGLDGNALIGVRDVFLTKYDSSGNKQ
jgi:hypothetical protein